VNEVKVEGNEITDTDFIKRELAPVQEAKTFKDVFAATNKSKMVSRHDHVGVVLFHVNRRTVFWRARVGSAAFGHFRECENVN
jgi:hypothetical protein